jgi:hypothetical protein
MIVQVIVRMNVMQLVRGPVESRRADADKQL